MSCHFSLRSTTRLNEVKNLNTKTGAYQILRYAQDDILIV